MTSKPSSQAAATWGSSSDTSGLPNYIHQSLCLGTLAEEADFVNRSIEEIIYEFHTTSNPKRTRLLIDRAQQETIVILNSLDHPEATPFYVLRGCLSTRSALSTAYSVVERMQSLAAANRHDFQLRAIGKGTFGVVFEIPGTTLAIKKTLHGPGLAHRLVDEFNFGREIQQAIYFKAVGMYKREPDFRGLIVPRVPCYLYCFGTIMADGKHSWWKQNGRKFPSGQGYDRAGPILYLERIMPLPQIVRTSLIEHFFPKPLVEAGLIDPSNKDALIRPYLGHSWEDLSQEQRQRGRSCLRNFPLYVDELEDLQMNPTIIAREMALALAAAHWSASIDLCGSEFVIGSRPTYSGDLQTFLNASLHVVDKTTNLGKKPMDIITSEDTPESIDFHNCAIQLWLIDFDKCGRFTIEDKTSERDIENLVKRTKKNDPYYPSSIPASNLEQSVWIAFLDTYLAASMVLLDVKLKEFIQMGRLLGAPEIPPKQRKIFFNRPARVMEEWTRQDRLAIDNEEYERRKTIAIRDGRYLPKK